MEKSKKKHGGNVWQASAQYGRDVEKILDYSANISPLGTPESVKQAIRDSLDYLIHYPDPDSVLLRQELAHHLLVGMEKIIVGNGSVELIYLLAKMIKPKQALLLHPTFSEYEFAIQSEGGRIKVLQLQAAKDFQIEVEEVLAALHDVQMVFLCNPNNPTGCLTKRENILRILDAAAAKNIFLIVDEAFLDFVENGEEFSLLPYINQYDNLFILRSLTKFFALPGLRIGCGIGNEKVLNSMTNLREPWTVNSLAQAAALQALRDQEYARKVKETIWTEKEFLYQELNKIAGIHAYQPSVNYVFLSIQKTGMTATQIQEAIAKEGILVRNCNSYPFLGENYLRVAVRTHPENEQLLLALKKILSVQE